MLWRLSQRGRSPQEVLVTENAYKYRELSTSTAIRLIKVSPERVNGCIACRLYHFDEKQQSTIKYHALSYLWGDPKSTRKIYLQDQGDEWRPFPLHENLWRFLDHAWRHRLFHRLFWTDHLCLNQNGHEEISQQVPRMHAIYRNAELVLIWLQLTEPERRGLQKFVRSRDRLKLMPKSCHGVMQRRLLAHQDAIWGVMGNPYWERVWIVQEVVVAKQVCVTSEDISISLEDLRAVVDTFRRTRHSPENMKASLWILCDMRAAGGKMPLWRILRDFTGYQSSRPVDRVYGLLGMVADHDDGSSPVDNIIVDYDRPMLHVLLDAMFESSPPLTEYRMATLCLGPWNTYDSVSLLESYITSSKTIQRHKDFAKLALEAFEAFNIIKSVPDAPHPYQIRDLIDNLFSSAARTDWKPTCQQSAALIGLLLARWSKGPIDLWKTRRERRGEAPSPWRCAVHRSLSGGSTDLTPKEIFAGLATTRRAWDRKGVVDACGEQSLTCDGPTMTCEIPLTGLRLLVGPPVNTGGEACLSLHRTESGS